MNELAFYKIDEKFLSFYYEENLAENIMNIIENEIKEEIKENKNELIDIIKSNEDDNDNDNDENKQIETLNNKLLPKIKFSSEIIKY